MKIETKYSINENVFFLNRDTLKVQCESIERIIYEENRGYSAPNTCQTIYAFNSTHLGIFNESELFKTKQELLDSL